MNNDLVELRSSWLKDYCNKHKTTRKHFFTTLEDEFLERKNQIFFKENSNNLFFKYRTLDQNTLNSIKENSIYLSHPRDFNDPYDSKAYEPNFDFKKEISRREASAILSSEPFRTTLRWDIISRNERRILINKAKCREDLENILRKFLPPHMQEINIFDREYDLNEERILVGDERLLISCFSSINNNMLMWSHYANYHRGICIGYDYNDSKYNDLLYPVSYQQNFVTNIHAAKLIKHIEWKYEHEWRIVITESLLKILDKITGNRVTNKISEFGCSKIYLGTKFKKNFEDSKTKNIAEELLEIAKVRNIPVYQMKLRNNSFKLYEEKLLW